MEELLEILYDIHPDIDFENCDTLIDDQLLDSFDIISIVGEVGDRFDVMISAEDIIPENFNSVSAIYALIQKLK